MRWDLDRSNCRRHQFVLHCSAMVRPILISLICLIFLVESGCDSDKIAKLEKQNQDLQAELKSQRSAADLDLQAKCSRDAKTFYLEGWSRDKDTIILTYINHYDKKDNKCFVLIEYHYNSHFAGSSGDSWTNDMVVYDVYENAKYGHFSENHYTYYKPTINTRSEVITCEISGKKCASIEEFNSLVSAYMSN
jgi:hypothetical protein